MRTKFLYGIFKLHVHCIGWW